MIFFIFVEKLRDIFLWSDFLWKGCVIFLSMLYFFDGMHVFFLWRGSVIFSVEGLQNVCVKRLHDFFCGESLRDFCHSLTHSLTHLGCMIYFFKDCLIFFVERLCNFFVDMLCNFF